MAKSKVFYEKMSAKAKQILSEENSNETDTVIHNLVKRNHSNETELERLKKENKKLKTANKNLITKNFELKSSIHNNQNK